MCGLSSVQSFLSEAFIGVKPWPRTSSIQEPYRLEGFTGRRACGQVTDQNRNSGLSCWVGPKQFCRV